jgi:prepilin-type processing-associated H-X9-DG protein
MNAKGFTGWDVLILLTTVVLLMGLVILANGPSHGARSGRIQCVSNLKQVALAFRMWSNEHEEQFPMAAPEMKGGAREPSLDGNPIPAFITISNALNSAKPLLCPNDKERGPQVAAFEGLAAKNVSYLIGIDACETNASAILTGDRNIVAPDLNQSQGLLTIASWETAEWSPKIHNQQGNVAFADGSALQATQNGLQNALRNAGFSTNRFAVP